MRRTVKLTLLLLLYHIVAGLAYSQVGHFVAQPYVTQGCMTCGFNPPGTIQEGANGVRVILWLDPTRTTLGGTPWTEWILIPMEAQWITKANNFELSFGNVLNWTVVGFQGEVLNNVTPDITFNRTEETITVLYKGYVIGSGVFNVEPTPCDPVIVEVPVEVPVPGPPVIVEVPVPTPVPVVPVTSNPIISKEARKELRRVFQGR